MTRSNLWPALRERRFAEQRYRCEGCGSRRDVSRLVGHHALPVRTYPQFELDPTNVVVLCPACHEAVHWISGRRLLVGLVNLLNDPALTTARRLDFGPIPQQFALALDTPAANDEEFSNASVG